MTVDRRDFTHCRPGCIDVAFRGHPHTCHVPWRSPQGSTLDEVIKDATAQVIDRYGPALAALGHAGGGLAVLTRADEEEIMGRLWEVYDEWAESHGAPAQRSEQDALDIPREEEHSYLMNTTTYPATHTTAPVIAKAASGPGALEGFETVCYDCGLRMANTVRSNVEADARDHIAYWAAKAAGPKAFRTFLLRGDR